MNPDIRSKKQSIVDVLCEDQNGVRFIVEMQVAKSPGFEKRAQYYASKVYSDQLRIGEDYKNLKEVIFLAIANYVVFPEKEAYKSDHILLDKLTYEHDLKDLYFTFIELPKFNKKKGDQLDSIIEKWCYFFKYADETSEADAERVIGEDLVIKEAYNALNYFNWTDEEKCYYDEMVKIDRDNLSAENYALELAKSEGKAESKIEFAKKLIQKKFSAEEVAELSSLSLDEVKALTSEEAL
jgi:predicted transposase/invertase (TIGR01784 family)